MKNREQTIESKRGFLKGDFELFHIKDRKDMQFDFHYHDFNKIIIFISGKVTYLIEGKAYKLKPWDILLVSSNEIHKPIIDQGVPYERIVLWLNQSFMDKHSSKECDLSTCFELAAARKYNLLRPEPELLRNLRPILAQLEAAGKNSDFGYRILRNALFMQFIVSINRMFLGIEKEPGDADVEYDKAIEGVIEYINGHLGEELTIDSLAASFFLSKYYLMHRFKKQTGYSIHNYIQQKRLIKAHLMIKEGMASAQVCGECGFGDYSSFVRAFKKMFGLSPRNYYKGYASLQKSGSVQGHF